MPKYASIRLIGDALWRALPDGSDFASLRALNDSAWVELADGGWCRVGAIAEGRMVEEADEPAGPPDEGDAEARGARGARGVRQAQAVVPERKPL